MISLHGCLVRLIAMHVFHGIEHVVLWCGSRCGSTRRVFGVGREEHHHRHRHTIIDCSIVLKLVCSRSFGIQMVARYSGTTYGSVVMFLGALNDLHERTLKRERERKRMTNMACGEVVQYIVG